MTLEERCEVALQGNEPERALRALVLELAKEGRKKADIYTLLENVLARSRARRSPEEQEDGLLNVMDALTGWCHLGSRLLPDDSSLSPSGAGIPDKKQ
jgi:hypothetical protein